MPLISALLFDPLFAAPQSQSAEEDIEKQLGGVSGVILTTSHEAVSKAVVALIQSNPQAPVASSAQGAQTRTVSSDAAGKFSFDRVPPGFYRLYVSHPVYLNPEALRPLTLTAGQHVSDISVELMEPATVTGLAVDEEGDPVSRANVQVIRNAYRGGIRRFDVIARVDSGDNGEFTIKRVPAGRYIIKADNQPTWTGTERAPVPAAKPGEKVYIPAGGYYGGLTSDTATPIDIAPGQTVAVGKIKMPNRL
jgi:protocatechuate 3,4-dioxygenase beta subunit